jgi:hypothetical protein
LRQFVIIALIIVAVAGCADKRPVSTEVYEALFTYVAKKDDVLFIREQPASLSNDELSAEVRELYSSFRFPEGVKAHSKTDFGSLQVRLISAEEYSRLFVSDCAQGWKNFHDKYPKAKSLIQISAVGFHPGRDQALIYITGGSGCLAGVGSLMLLQKKSGRWAVVREINLWVA